MEFQPEDDFTPSAEPPKRENPLRRNATKKATPKKSTTAPSAAQAKKLCEPLGDMYRMAAMGLMPFDPEIAMLIGSEADKLGESWLKLAETSPGFRKFLNKMNQASGWGNVMMAHLPIAMAVAGRLTPELFGNGESTDTLTKETENAE